MKSLELEAVSIWMATLNVNYWWSKVGYTEGLFHAEDINGRWQERKRPTVVPVNQNPHAVHLSCLISFKIIGWELEKKNMERKYFPWWEGNLNNVMLLSIPINQLNYVIMTVLPLKSIYAPAFWIWHWWEKQGGICMHEIALWPIFTTFLIDWLDDSLLRFASYHLKDSLP